MQIESVKPRSSELPGHFGILLSFYNREADVTKVELVEFDCKEPLDQNEDGEERKAGEVPDMKLSDIKTENLATQFLENAMAQQQGMNPMEFSVLYLIERQLPIYWQRFFEQDAMNMKGQECYQFHAFIVKRNTYFFN